MTRALKTRAEIEQELLVKNQYAETTQDRTEYEVTHDQLNDLLTQWERIPGPREST